ncbi:MAG: dephospho-CoA kinase, partial [Mycobacteriaceae bacterium]
RDWLIANSTECSEFAQISEQAVIAASDHKNIDKAWAVYQQVQQQWFSAAYLRAWQWAQESGWKADN